MGKWVPKFIIEFEANIWNIHAADATTLLLELRNPEEESLSYALVDMEKGAVNMPDIPDVNWFSHVLYADRNLLLTQVYSDSDNPDDLSFVCYDMHSGKCTWQAEGMQFIGVEGPNFAFRKGDGKQVYIDSKSGNEIHRNEQSMGVSTPEDPLLEFPAHYTEGDEYFEDVADYIRTEAGAEPVRAIDYAENGNHIIFSYYKKEVDGNLGLDLLSLNTEGETSLFQNLGKDLRGIADPPFMFYNGNLIFVKEKRHFFVYALPSQN